MNSPLHSMHTLANQSQFMPGPGVHGVHGHMPNSLNSHVILPSSQMLNMPHNPMAMMQQHQQQQQMSNHSHNFPEHQQFGNSGNLPVLQTQAGVPVQSQVQGQMQMQMMHAMPHHVGWQAPGLLPSAGCASDMGGHMFPCHDKFLEAPTEVQPQPARPSQEGMSRERSRSRTRQNGGESKPQSAQTGGEHV